MSDLYTCHVCSASVDLWPDICDEVMEQTGIDIIPELVKVTCSNCQETYVIRKADHTIHDV